jgi:hypothetical protein
MTPNYQWKWVDVGVWVDVYVDPTGETVIELPSEYEYPSSWLEFLEAEDIEIRPYKQDNVNSPSHYGQGVIECIDYIEDFLTREEFIGYLRGNIAKYQHRWRYKNGLEDLKKAQWYQNRLIEVVSNDDL